MTAVANLLNSIAAELNTTDKNLCINVALSMLINSGLTVGAAMDTLMGEGAYKNLAGHVYDALRAKQN